MAYGLLEKNSGESRGNGMNIHSHRTRMMMMRELRGKESRRRGFCCTSAKVAAIDPSMERAEVVVVVVWTEYAWNSPRVSIICFLPPHFHPSTNTKACVCVYVA